MHMYSLLHGFKAGRDKYGEAGLGVIFSENQSMEYMRNKTNKR